MRRRRKIRILLILLIALLLGAGSFLYMNKSLRPVLVGLSAARVESVAARAMNDAILEILSARDTGDGLLKIYTASEGGVYLLTANAGKLNTIAADCADSAQKKIMALGEQGVSVPVGTLTGIPLLAGMGPAITMRFTPAGAVRSAFSSQFRSAGINQTLHRITLEMTATVRIILPGESHTVTVYAQAPIAENVIVGDVPGAYTNVANEEDMMNMIPEEPRD